MVFPSAAIVVVALATVAQAPIAVPASDAQGEAPAPESWALTTFAIDVAPVDVAGIEAELRRSISARSSARLQPKAATAALLAEARAAGLACSEMDKGCLARLGAAAGVDRLLSVVLRPTPAGLDLEAVLLDVHADRVLVRARRTVIAPPPAQVLVDLAHELVSPESFVGAIELSTLPLDVVVHLDGAVVALSVDEAGNAALSGVRPGRHRVDVRGQAGTFRADIDVVAGLVARVRVALRAPPAQPSPAPAALPASAWVTVAAGGLGVLAGLGAGALALVLETPVQHDLRAIVIGTGATLMVASLVGAATAAVGGTLWTIDDARAVQ